jgi:hypothetical protein
MQPGLTLTERHYLTMPLLTNPLAKPLVKLYLSVMTYCAALKVKTLY